MSSPNQFYWQLFTFYAEKERNLLNFNCFWQLNHLLPRVHQHMHSTQTQVCHAIRSTYYKPHIQTSAIYGRDRWSSLASVMFIQKYPDSCLCKSICWIDSSEPTPALSYQNCNLSPFYLQIFMVFATCTRSFYALMLKPSRGLNTVPLKVKVQILSWTVWLTQSWTLKQTGRCTEHAFTCWVSHQS